MNSDIELDSIEFNGYKRTKQIAIEQYRKGDKADKLLADELVNNSKARDICGFASPGLQDDECMHPQQPEIQCEWNTDCPFKKEVGVKNG